MVMRFETSRRRLRRREREGSRSERNEKVFTFFRE